MRVLVVIGLAASGLLAASQVMAVPPRPAASFTVSPAQPVAGQAAAYTSTSSDPNDDVTEVAWDFDDDGEYEVADNSAPFEVTHTFATSGPKRVGIMARAGPFPGDVDTETQTVVVNAPADPRGRPAPASVAMSPFPTVRIVGLLTRTGARIRRLSVKAPAFATVYVRCRGRTEGCPSRPSVAAIGAHARVVRFRRFERRLKAGAELRIAVSREGVVGKHTSFRVRRGRAPARRDRCLVPGVKGPVHCPDS